MIWLFLGIYRKSFKMRQNRDKCGFMAVKGMFGKVPLKPYNRKDRAKDKNRLKVKDIYGKVDKCEKSTEEALKEIDDDIDSKIMKRQGKLMKRGLCRP